MGKVQLFIFSVLLLGGLASCKTQEVDPAVATTYATNIKTIDSYIASQNWTVKPTSVTSNSGLYMALTKASSSTVSPQEGQELEFTYTLSVLSTTAVTTGTSSSAISTTIVTAKKVDSTYATNPAFIPLFKGILPEGLREGLLLMHEGDQAVLCMPSIIAYGESGRPDVNIPGNTPVRFDITLNRTRTETQQLDEYVASTGLKLTQTTSTGLRFFLTTPNAAGDSVKTAVSAGKTLTIRYVAKQLHAKTAIGFDSTGTGLNSYKDTAGFAEGLAKLRVGEKATLLVPSTIGYSTTGLADKTKNPAVYIVSPYAPLRYDIEVVSAK